MKIKITTRTQAELAKARLDNSILRQQLQSYGRVIDLQSNTIARLQQRIKFLEMCDTASEIHFPNTNKEF